MEELRTSGNKHQVRAVGVSLSSDIEWHGAMRGSRAPRYFFSVEVQFTITL
jgi:hypothetical protein